MNKDLRLDLPIKLEELLNFSFNFDNLMKAISYLHNNDLNFVTNFKDFENRISILESLKSDIGEIKIQARNIQNTNDNLNRSILSMQERLSKMDSKISEIDKKTNDNSTHIKDFEKKIVEHNDNLDNLNKVVEENIKRMHNYEYDININKKDISIIKENIEQLRQSDKDLESLIQKKNELLNARIDENKKSLEKINNNISDLNSLCSNLKNDLDLKHKELQSTIANVIQNISSGKDITLEGNNQSNNENGGDNTGLLIKTVNDNILLSSTISDIQNEQKKFKEFIERYNQEKEEIDNDFEKNENDIIDLQNEISSIKKEIKLVFSSDNGEEKKKLNLEDLDLGNYVTNDMHKRLSDNIRIISSSLGSMPKRDEFEKELRKINSRLETIELIQQGVTSGPRTMINSELVQKDGEKLGSQKLILSTKADGKDKNVSNIKKMIINTINEEIKNLNFGENTKISEIMQNIKKCEEDISKNYSSIINIRNKLGTTPNQNDLINLRGDIERLSEESKKKFIEILRTLNGDEDEESEDEDDKWGFSGFCMKKKIDVLVGKYHELFGKLTAIQNKNNALSKEIKEEVKQNLKNETLKVVEEFKLKLDNFTSKFEIELRSKIDSSGLSSFENKLNSRIRGDLREKLDRVEMQKNNNQIRRKIDSLENKISKTLVDTIIDLQMDEAPLIIKKNSRNYEICASCNQIIQSENNLRMSRNFFKNNSLSSVGKTFRKSKKTLNLNSNSVMNQTNINANNNNKKLPEINSYTQSK